MNSRKLEHIYQRILLVHGYLFILFQISCSQPGTSQQSLKVILPGYVCMLHTLSNVCRDSLGGHGAAVVLAAVVGAAHEAARAVQVRVAVAAAQVAGGGGGAAAVLGLATHEGVNIVMNCVFITPTSGPPSQ